MAKVRSDGGAEARSVWRYGTASRAHVVIDGAAYFRLVHNAMMNARQRIMLIGWDFDTRIKLAPGKRWWQLRSKLPPAMLGAFVVWLARHKPDVEILVLKWNIGALKSFLRGRMPLQLLRWKLHERIRFRLDGAHPVGCSHHQKIVVIDDRFAVCGGIDMTGDRWDTRDHLPHDPRRRRPTGRHYGPWHDCTMLLEGEPAALLGEYGRLRWRQAGAGELAPCRPQQQSPWPESLAAEFRDVEVGIARTRSQYDDIEEVREIEALYLEHIARARRFIYAENQYFASRRIAEAMSKRLGEPEPPEILIVNPLSLDGWLEREAMESARVRLLHGLFACDPKHRFSIWTPFADDDVPIYVHAKLMIVDDEMLRIGSANMNNRSLGLDSECDVFIDCAREANRGNEPTITRLRHSLLAEHSGLSGDEVAALLDRHGTMAGMLDARPANGRGLRRLPLRELTDVEKSLADNEVLDPERPEEMLSFYKRRRLIRGVWHRARGNKHRRREAV